MSYNIDTFKLKRLENFKIPVASLYKHDREDWHPERENRDDGETWFHSCEVTIKGIIKGEIFEMTSIDCTGEGSGTTMEWILEPAFKDSTGVFEASCVWAGGDSINKILVEDGEVDWIDIEI